MNPQKYCISLDLAKRLKELGVKQESLFWWCEQANGECDVRYVENYERDFVDVTGGSYERCSAFTVAELGEMLPLELKGELLRTLPTRTISGGWRVDFMDEGMLYAGGSEAEARGLMLEYLIKNGFVTLDK